MAFIFGGNTPWTYEQLQRKRAVADSLLGSMGEPKNVGEGLAAIGKALAYRGIEKRAGKEEARMRGEFDAKWGALLGGAPGAAAPRGAYGATAGPPAPPRDPNSPDAVAADTMFALGKINPKDREILAQTLMAEAGGEGYGGMLAAGAVIDNRRKGGDYGDGWEGVIMKPGQFSAWNGVTGYAGGEGGLDMSKMTPSEEAYAAADAILTGNYEDPTKGATHYYNPNVANPKWGQQAGGDWQSIGNHVFGMADAGRDGQPAPQTQPQGGMDLGALVGLASDPMASPAQKAVVEALIQQQLQAADPLRAIEMQKAQLELAQMQDPQPKEPTPTDDMREYEFAKTQGYEGTFQQFVVEMKKAGASSTTVTVGGDGTPADDALRKKLMEGEGAAWSDYLKAGTTASGMQQDMELLDQVIELAPQGPVTGRLAEMFPGVSDAAGVFQSVVKRVAPSLRVEGSGSQSDIEYNGFLQSLPALSNRPEANRAIAAFLKSKAQVNLERGKAVAAYQNGEIDAPTARKRIQEIDSQSIMTPEIEALLGGLGEAQASGAEMPVGTIEDGYRYVGGDPALPESWEPVQ